MTGIIILAAGASTRLGRHKQKLVYKGKPLLQHAIQAALSLPNHSIVVVSGYDYKVVQEETTSTNIQVAINEQRHTGMASSIKCGMQALLNLQPQMEQVIIMLCDQPFVTGEILSKLVSEQQSSGKPIVASAYNNTVGAPVLFTQQYFTALMLLSGQEGARKLIQQHLDDVAQVPFSEGAIDIDTPEDVERLMKM
jgi:molybdenum cofactor cytidylyltransferase